MKQETRYSYEKRIKSLQERVSTLEEWRYVAMSIYEAAVSCVNDHSSINKEWVLHQFRRMMK